MSKRRISDWQIGVLADLAAIAEAFPGEVEMLGRPRHGSDEKMTLRMRVRTADIAHVGGGLRLDEYEEFLVVVGQHDVHPPQVEVDHLRFLNRAHVLQGTRLCLYLDPSREWDPDKGFGGLLDRLSEWLGDAAAGRFNAQTALYHAVGGVLHETDGAPTVVIRDTLATGGIARHGWLVERAPLRFDLVLNRPDDATAGWVEHVPILRLDSDLPLGAGTNLRSLLVAVEDPYAGHPAPGDVFRTERLSSGLAVTLLTVLGASAVRKADGMPQRVVLAVPHPTGGPPHLLVANIPASGADGLRAMARASTKRSSVIDIHPERIGPDIDVEWLPVSDERAEVTTRRDSTRPVAAFAGKTVHVWGCGGLGSWVAEFVVRAGAMKGLLCDPGRITGGLLVRQNFVETDVGNSKVEALASRLRAISDTVEVVTRERTVPTAEDFTGADVVIDATVSIAISRMLDAAAATAKRPVLAQMATDVQTGTLGVLSVSMPPQKTGPLTIDRQAGDVVKADGALEAFHELWGSDGDADEIIPTRGCSTPTFHGSAADLTGVAASLTSILGSHLGAQTAVSGTHLISLPHGEAGPLREFVPVAAGGVEGGAPTH